MGKIARRILIWLVVPLLVVVAGSFFRAFSKISTCRCCLWTANQSCRNFHTLLADGFYHFNDPFAGIGAGIFLKGNRNWDEYTFEQISADRIRFSWPIRSITLDLLNGQSEWHLVVESRFWLNLIILVMGSLLVEASILAACNYYVRPDRMLSNSNVILVSAGKGIQFAIAGDPA